MADEDLHVVPVRHDPEGNESLGHRRGRTHGLDALPSGGLDQPRLLGGRDAEDVALDRGPVSAGDARQGGPDDHLLVPVREVDVELNGEHLRQRLRQIDPEGRTARTRIPQQPATLPFDQIPVPVDEREVSRKVAEVVAGVVVVEHDAIPGHEFGFRLRGRRGVSELAALVICRQVVRILVRPTLVIVQDVPVLIGQNHVLPVRAAALDACEVVEGATDGVRHEALDLPADLVLRRPSGTLGNAA